MRIAGLVPARGGSKGIPGKNMASCVGKPLLSYAFEAARLATRLPECYFSSDDEGMIRFAEESGIMTPFLRPPELAQDDTPMVAVLRHFLSWSDKEGKQLDAVVLLQPTSPLRKGRHIDEAIALFEKHRPMSLVSVVRVPHQYAPESVMQMESGYLVPFSSSPVFRRQDKPLYFGRNGPAILIVSREAILMGHCYAPPCLGYEMEMLTSIDVDDPESLVLAGLLLRYEAEQEALLEIADKESE